MLANDAGELQTSTKDLVLFCQQVDLTVNISKPKTMHNKSVTVWNVIIENVTLEKVREDTI